MRYMLLIYGCVRYPPGAADRERKAAAVNAFVEMCAARGVLEAYDPLQAADTAETVRVREDDTLVIDGPYAETREQLGGYFILDVRDRAEAVELARACPFAAEGAVEVRPIMDVPDLVRIGPAGRHGTRHAAGAANGDARGSGVGER